MVLYKKSKFLKNKSQFVFVLTFLKRISNDTKFTLVLLYVRLNVLLKNYKLLQRIYILIYITY